MFTNDTDIFVTRVTNPTDKPFCHRGLPRYPVVPAKGSIDVKGVYTKVLRDEWLGKALMAGMQIKVFCMFPCEHVQSVSELPSPTPAGRPVDPDTLPMQEIGIVKPLVDLSEPVNEVSPFKAAASESEKRGEPLPAGVVRHDDLMKADADRTVSDSELFKRMTSKPVTEKFEAAAADKDITLPADDVYAESRRQEAAASESAKSDDAGKGKGGKKKRAWMSGL